MFDLAGKIAIVTGGSRGIGRATSLALAEAGAHVLVNYRSNEEAAKQTLALIEEAGGQGEILGFDVADPDSVDRAIKEAVGRHGQPEGWDVALPTNYGHGDYWKGIHTAELVASLLGVALDRRPGERQLYEWDLPAFDASLTAELAEPAQLDEWRIGG